MIKVDSLSFEYPGLLALDGVSISVGKGRIAALVGPNGAGKTTLLRCLAALERPVSGSIRIGDVDTLKNPRECHAMVGYLRDVFGLYDDLTVERCLKYAAYARGITGEKETATAVELAARRLNIHNSMGARTGALSRGMRQRLAIAQAIIHEPKVLILDEPASGLDPEARHSLSVLFKDLAATGMTIIVSSHILTELEEYSTDMIIINKGRVVSAEGVTKGGETVVTVRVEMSRPDERLRSVVESVPGACGFAADGELRAVFDCPAGAKESALKTLVEAGLPVVGFTEIKSSMHASYLTKIKGARESGAV